MTAHLTPDTSIARAVSGRKSVRAATSAEADIYERPEALAGIGLPTVLALSSVERVGERVPLLRKGSGTELVASGLLDRNLRLTSKGAAAADDARRWVLDYAPLVQAITEAGQRTDAFLAAVVAGDLKLANS